MAFEINIGPNIRKSPYFDATVAEGVRSFSVYNHMFIPGHFGDPAGEYARLINGVAMWDVGAQRQVELAGPDAARLAAYLSARNIDGAKIGQGRYVPICDYDGFLINDPVLLKLAEDRFWLSIADSDIVLWAGAVARERRLDVRVFEPDASPMAIQGPTAVDVAAELFGSWVRDLKYFWFRETDLNGIPLLLARSGWSKQGGFELYLTDGTRGTELWNLVKEVGAPHGIGPGAPNDLERLESGLVSYGADARRQTLPATPFEIGLGHLIDLNRDDDFIGKKALAALSAERPRRHRVGLFIDGPHVTGNEHPLPVLRNGIAVGTLSEMAHSPRLGRNIGHAIVSTEIALGTSDLDIVFEGSVRGAAATALPFIQT